MILLEKNTKYGCFHWIYIKWMSLDLICNHKFMFVAELWWVFIFVNVYCWCKSEYLRFSSSIVYFCSKLTINCNIKVLIITAGRNNFLLQHNHTCALCTFTVQNAKTLVYLAYTLSKWKMCHKNIASNIKYMNKQKIQYMIVVYSCLCTTTIFYCS